MQNDDDNPKYVENGKASFMKYSTMRKTEDLCDRYIQIQKIDSIKNYSIEP